MTSGQILVLLIVAIIFGAPTIQLWIKSHYKVSDKKRRDKNPNDQVEITQLLQIANDLQERVATLESILDRDLPDWRHKR